MATRNRSVKLVITSPERVETERKQRLADLTDLVSEKLSQAEALSCTLYGEQGETFRSLNEDIQDRVMWLLSKTIQEGGKAFAELESTMNPTDLEAQS